MPWEESPKHPNLNWLNGEFQKICNFQKQAPEQILLKENILHIFIFSLVFFLKSYSKNLSEVHTLESVSLLHISEDRFRLKIKCSANKNKMLQKGSIVSV